jgi:transcriptional regulator with XRE-family HTH domain
MAVGGFTKQFVDALVATGKSDKELAELVGVTIATINRIRNGPKRPSTKLIDKLTDALGLTVRIEAGGEVVASNEPGHDFRDALIKIRKLFDCYGDPLEEGLAGSKPSDAELMKWAVRHLDLRLHLQGRPRSRNRPGEGRPRGR